LKDRALILTNEELAIAHQMEAEAIIIAGKITNSFSPDARGFLLFMLALKIIADEYPSLYKNLPETNRRITEWIVAGAPEKLDSDLIARKVVKRLLNFPETTEGTIN
jgi:hypothetical protein